MPQSVKLPLATGRVPEPEGRDRLLRRRSPTTSSSATPFPPAASTSPRRRSWGRAKRTSRRRGAGTRGPRTRSRPMSLFVMQGVSKRYGGVRALQDAELTIEAGRIHAVLGENGAGKSTLIKIMAGVVAPDEGRMLLDGEPVSFASPAAANAAGIACIFQELSLIPDLSVADNIAISNPPRRFGLIDRRAQRRDRRGGAGACRRRQHPSAGAGQGLVAVAAADGRDRQGARPQAAHPDPRRSHVGADRRRRDEDLRRPEAAARGGSRAALHLAPDARDRRTGRRMHGVLQRPQRRELRRGHQDRQRGRRADDRPRVQRRVSGADDARGERCARRCSKCATWAGPTG